MKILDKIENLIHEVHNEYGTSKSVKSLAGILIGGTTGFLLVDMLVPNEPIVNAVETVAETITETIETEAI